MSRCFPYPPPGYCANGERNKEAALIEASSIKLQREKEKAKAERKKERHREKKEKKRESKVTTKQDATESGHGKKRKRTDEKAHKGEKDSGVLEGRDIQKRREDEAEQLERSNLTEEHGQPVCPENPCYSSDSTENSNKRKRPASPVNGIRRIHGNIIRIRVPSQKHKEPDVAVSEERLCSTSNNSEVVLGPTQERLCSTSNNSEVVLGPTQEELCSTKANASAGGFSHRLDKEPSSSTSWGAGTFGQDPSGSTTGSTSLRNGIQLVESLYKDLVENWVFPSLETELRGTDLDEQEWLFQRKRPDRERAKASSDVLCTGIATSWPHAQYLPEADIYALPFTVPF